VTTSPLGSLSSRPGATPTDTASLAREIAPVRINLGPTGLVGTPLSASLLGDRIQRRHQEIRAAFPVRGVAMPLMDESNSSPGHDLACSPSKDGGPRGRRID
jgi:hypothetical protein